MLLQMDQNFLTLFGLGGGGSVCANFYFRELPEKFGVKAITCCHGYPVFDAMFSQILTF